MKVPTRTLLLFNVDLPEIFFLNYYGTKDICCRGRREEFSKEQNIPKIGLEHGGFRTARAVGYDMEMSVTFC